MGSNEGDTRNTGTAGYFSQTRVASYIYIFKDGKQFKISAQEAKEILRCLRLEHNVKI